MQALRGMAVIVVLFGLATAAPAQPPDGGPGNAARLARYPQMKPALNEPAPRFTLQDLDGQEVRLQDLIGRRPIVLEFGSYT